MEDKFEPRNFIHHFSDINVVSDLSYPHSIEGRYIEGSDSFGLMYQFFKKYVVNDNMTLRESFIDNCRKVSELRKTMEIPFCLKYFGENCIIISSDPRVKIADDIFVLKIEYVNDTILMADEKDILNDITLKELTEEEILNRICMALVFRAHNFVIQYVKKTMDRTGVYKKWRGMTK